MQNVSQAAPQVNQKNSDRQKKQNYIIRVSNGIFAHRQKMGIALYEFLWLLDRVTWVDPKTGIGWCLRRKPLRHEQIAAELHTHVRTTDINMKRLEDFGYIVRVRTPRGYSIGVCKCKKFISQHAEDKPSDSQNPMTHSSVSDSQNPMTHPQSDSYFFVSDSQNPMNAKDSAFDSAVKETLQNPAATAGDSTTALACKPTPQASISLPQWVPIPEWSRFLRKRKELHCGNSNDEQEHLLSRLNTLRQDGSNPADVLNQSFSSNWKGLFPIRGGNKNDPNQRTRNNLRAVGLDPNTDLSDVLRVLGKPLYPSHTKN